MGGPSTIRWLLAGVLSVGCNTLAGIDDDYIAAPDPALAGSKGSGAGAEGGFNGIGGEGGVGGATGVGGASGEQGAGGGDGSGGMDGSGGTGGPDATGGLNGLGGSAGTDTSGGAGGAPCGPNQKSCQNICVEPSVDFGCSFSNCEPCPDPAPNSAVSCIDRQCVAQCKTGFVPIGGQCVPENTVDAGGGASGNGGSAGSAGSGGSAGSAGRGQCVVEQCPSCSVFRGVACCTFFRTCGCSFVDQFYCI